MTKGKSTWKYNKLLTSRRNYFGEGGPRPGAMQMSVPSVSAINGQVTVTPPFTPPQKNPNLWQQSMGVIKNTFTDPLGTLAMTGSPALALAQGVSSVAGAIGTGVGSLMANGLESGAGNVVKGVGDIANAIPIVGGLFKGVLDIVGGGVNALFGSKENKENVAKIESNIANLNAFKTNAADFDTLSQNWDNAVVGMSFDNSFVGKDGLFSNKIKNKANNLRGQIATGTNWVQRSLANNANNISDSQMNNLQSTYAAYGGPINRYGKGGSIHIKPENRGKFTETKRRTGKTTEELTHSSNPLTRKRAIFAQNAKKWHHAFGGELNTQGSDFTNGLLYIDNGGSHEANPYEGVPMGMDPEGTSNLVEEGETIFNDYVFSRRLRVPKALRNKYKLGNVSFADASKKLAKESEERSNDPISMRGLEFFMNDLAAAQEELKASMRESNQYAIGGKVNKFAGDDPWTPSKINTYNYIKNGYYGLGSTPFWIKDGNYTDEYVDFINNRYDVNAFRQHLKNQFDFYDKASPNDKKSNRYKAIKYFIDSNPEWYNNRGSIDIWNIDEPLMKQVKSYALSKPGFMHPEEIAAAALATNTGTTPAEAAPVTPAEEAAVEQAIQNRYYYNKGTVDNPNWVLLEGQDNAPLWMRNNKYRYSSENARTDGVKGTDYYYDVNEDLDLGRNKAEFLRYAPALGFGISALADTLGLTNKPDYSNADALLNAVQGAGSYQPVRFKPIGNYLTYRPFDRDYYINKMNAEAGASRRMIANTSGGNRATAMAGILAADNNYLNQLGTLARQAEEYNLAQRQQVEDFNRATNTTNSQGFLQADMANQKALAEQKEFMLKGTQAVAEMRERERLAAQQNKSANLSGLFQTLGDIGFEAKNDNMTRRLIESGWAPGAEKVYRGKANGGKIKRKKKGLTY